jgi:hypothetical protein
MAVLKPSHSLASVPFSCNPLGLLSAYPKCLLLVKFITIIIHENRMERWVKKNIWKYVGEGTVRAQGRCRGN